MVEAPPVTVVVAVVVGKSTGVVCVGRVAVMLAVKYRLTAPLFPRGSAVVMLFGPVIVVTGFHSVMKALKAVLAGFEQ